MMKSIEKLKQLERFLNTRIYGREKLIKAIILSLINRENVLIIGKHGEAKSMITHLIAKHTNLKTFYKQIHQQTTLQDILGIINPVEYLKGNLDLLKTDFWMANIQFYDEFLRNSELVDFLMEVMVEHKCSKSILGEVNLDNLISVIATSNPTTQEYHTEALDLALKDRFGYIVNCRHLIEDNLSEFQKVVKNLNETNNDDNEFIEFDIEELKNLHNLVKNVIINDETYNLMNSFATNCLENSVDLSTRLMLKLKKAIQTLTIYNQKEQPTIDEFKESVDLVFANRIDREAYLKITEKLFNLEEFELNQKIVELTKKIGNEEVGKSDLKNFLDFYLTVSDKYLFFSEHTKSKVNEIFRQLNNLLKSDFHSKDFDERVAFAKEMIRYADLEELNEFFKSLDFKVETKFLPPTQLRTLKNEMLNKGFTVKEETFENKTKLIISISELSNKQLNDFVKLTDNLTARDLISRF